MTWEIACGIAAGISFIIGICTLIFKLSGILTKLVMSVENLNGIIKNISRENKEEHTLFMGMLESHETRLHDLEASK